MEHDPKIRAAIERTQQVLERMTDQQLVDQVDISRRLMLVNSGITGDMKAIWAVWLKMVRDEQRARKRR